jgi:hypothetical protein
VLKGCTDCSVLVCEVSFALLSIITHPKPWKLSTNKRSSQYCLLDSPPCCPCSFCTTQFYCPVCALKPSVRAQCTREEELRAIEAAREREMERLKIIAEDRAWADEVAEAVGQFYLGMDE